MKNVRKIELFILLKKRLNVVDREKIFICTFCIVVGKLTIILNGMIRYLDIFQKFQTCLEIYHLGSRK